MTVYQISRTGREEAIELSRKFGLNEAAMIEARRLLEEKQIESSRAVEQVGVSADSREGKDDMSVLSDAERAKIEAWTSSVQEAQRRAREDAVIGNVGLIRTVRFLQNEKDEAAAQQAEQDKAAKAETLRATNEAALDDRHKARELSIWRYSGLGTDEQFEKQWPAKRAELGRAEINKSISATQHSLYRDL